MERLTERHSGVAVIRDKNRHKEAMEVLAKYEETGLTPEQVQKLVEMNVPKKLNRIFGVFGEKYECPNCGSALVDIDALAGHCKWCGQRVEV